MRNEVYQSFINKNEIGDINSVLITEKDFDCVILGDVLEHLIDPQKVLERIKLFLNDEAVLIASIPNIAHWSIIKALIEGNWEYQDAGILDRTHLRFFTKNSIIRLFCGAGYKIEQLLAVQWLSGGPIPKKLVESLVMSGIRAERLYVEAYDYQYLVVARWKKEQQQSEIHLPLLTKDKPKLASIIIPCWNGLEYTKKCLESIFKHTHSPYELILIDNGSMDGTYEYLKMVAQKHDSVSLLRNDYNLGFGMACNQGIKAARGEYLVFLNNDTIVSQEWLKRLIAAVNRNDGIGLVGPRSNYISGIQVVPEANYDENDISEFEVFAERWTKTHENDGQFVGRLVGLCLLVKREVIERIGGFDIRFGLGNFEDDDLCLRALVAGFKLWMANDVFIHHYGSKTFKSNSLSYAYLLERNWHRFCYKWGISESGVRSYNILRTIQNAPASAKKYCPLEITRTQEIVPKTERRFKLLMLPDFSSRWEECVRNYLQAFSPEEKASLIINIEPYGKPAFDEFINNLRKLIIDCGYNEESIPDLEVRNMPLSDVDQLFSEINSFLPTGELEQGLNIYIAQSKGVIVMESPTANSLREIYLSWKKGDH